MNTNPAALALSTIALLGLTACSVAAPTVPQGPTPPTVAPTTPSALPPASAAPSVPASVDTPAEQAAWTALMDPDGEYAALASYTAVLDRYGQVQPYARIAGAEARHIRALERRLRRMGVEVPANPYLGKVSAPADLTTAATAWAAGEVANVALYDRLLEQASGDQALTRVFENLRRASQENHLPAFEDAAAQGGTTA